jgi:hypothetical protein
MDQVETNVRTDQSRHAVVLNQGVQKHPGLKL